VTTNTLAKKYAYLSADERFSLLLAANERGDRVEEARLAQSAGRASFRVSDLFGRSLAYVIVSMIHHAELLNLTALFFKTTALADSATGKVEKKLTDAARMFGYLMNIHADAWLEFCKRENLAPSIGTEGLPGEELLQKALEESRLMGFSETEALEYARRADVSIDQLKTMTNIADELQETYKVWVGKWE
jgi:hypothetical protein